MINFNCLFAFLHNMYIINASNRIYKHMTTINALIFLTSWVDNFSSFISYPCLSHIVPMLLQIQDLDEVPYCTNSPWHPWEMGGLLVWIHHLGTRLLKNAGIVWIAYFTITGCRYFVSMVKKKHMQNFRWLSGLVQNCCNFIASTLELLQSCT